MSWLVGRRPGGGTTTYLGNVQSLQSAWQRDRQTQHTTERQKKRVGREIKKGGERNRKGRKERQGEKVVTKELGCSLSVQYS